MPSLHLENIGNGMRTRYFVETVRYQLLSGSVLRMNRPIVRIVLVICTGLIRRASILDNLLLPTIAPKAVKKDFIIMNL